MDKPNVSVVIPTYNRSHIVTRAIYSALNQSAVNVEVVVVDDGSTDNTEKVVKELDHRVKYVKQDNGGVSSARNTGVKESSNELVALLDSDDVLMPNSLAFRGAFLNSNPDFDVIVGSCTSFTNDFIFKGTKSFEMYPSHKDEDFLDKQFATRYLLTNTTDRESFHDIFKSYVQLSKGGIPFSTSSTMILRTKFLEIGGYDTSLRNSEDLEFYFRMTRDLHVKYEYLRLFAGIVFQTEGLTRQIKEGVSKSDHELVLKKINISY